MKKTRIKPQSLTRAEFDAVVDRIAATTTDLRVLEAGRDEAIQAVQTAYAPDIERCQASLKADVTLAEKYAEEHRAELLPGKAKSAETALARWGFAIANKKAVKPINKQIEEETIIAALKANALAAYVRQIEEIAKDKIITDAVYDEELKVWVLVTSRGSRVVLGELGLKLVQSETFYIEPKVDGAETVKI